MWTYLAIFFSLVLLGGVFVRRWILFERRGQGQDEGAIKEPGAKKTKRPKIAKKDQVRANSLCKRGEALVAAGKDEEAIKCFVQTLAADPNNIEAQKMLAMLYLQKQLFGAAAALFKQLGEATNDPVHYSHLGLSLYQAGELDGAKNAYQKAVDLDPSRPARFISLAHVYKALEQPYNAIIAVNKALEIEKDNLDFLFFLIDLHTALENWPEVKYFLRRVLEIDPKNKEAKKLLRAVQ